MIDCHIQLKQGQFDLDQRFQSDQSVIGLFGASGSGKTTILHSIAGLVTPQAGWIKIKNQTWFDQAQRINLSTQQRRIGLVFQDAQHQTIWRGKTACRIGTSIAVFTTIVVIR